ncbi:MAG: L-threonylcarbamoyladenylate synthase [Syntrophobacteraceae bacterium]
MLSKTSRGPKIFRLGSAEINAETVEQAAAVLRSGGVVIYPTETFYALGAVASLEKAVSRVFQIKGRDFGKPLPLIAADLPAVLSAASQWPQAADLLARVFWPGPLSLVIPARLSLSQALHAETGKIALRVSSHPVASLLAKLSGGLLISTSANISGAPAPQNPAQVDKGLLACVDAMLDAGNLPGGFPSTIVDVTVYPVEILREGKIAAEDILGAFEK